MRRLPSRKLLASTKRRPTLAAVLARLHRREFVNTVTVMDKRSVVIAASLLVLVVALGVWFTSLQRGVPAATVDTAPVRSTATAARQLPDTAAGLSQEAAALDLGDLEVEFQVVDNDLNQL
jgi:hypothetical protein